MTGNRQLGPGKVEPCHLRARHEYRTGLVNERRAVDAVYLELTKPVMWSSMVSLEQMG